ncbi:MAG TPA: PAS domain-containing protein [Steroidobacteraceae bacterium]|nr:PAS domain-containing protein [Steroidobacteraceae bacterium]
MHVPLRVVAPSSGEPSSNPQDRAHLMERLARAVGGAAIGLWELDFRSERTSWFNDWCERLSLDACEGRDPLGRWGTRIHPEDLPEAARQLNNHLAGTKDHYDAEYRIRDRSGRWRWVFERGRVIDRAADGAPLRMVGVCMDIDSRKEAELGLREALRRSEFRYRSVASMAPGYVFEYRFGPDGSIQPVWFSEGVQGVFGCSVEEFLLRGGFRAFVHPEGETVARRARRSLASDVPECGEVRIRTASGESKWLATSSIALRDPQSGAVSGFIGAAYDVTARKLAERERQELEREIIEIANREQQRIGSDLHDGLGQDLTGIALMLRGIGAQLRKEGSAACLDIEDVISLVNNAIESTRALARGLSPVSAERDGLAAALQALAARATERYGVPVSFESRTGQPVRLDETSATHLYRIAQEALTNAMRHSLASEVAILLAANGETLRLEITDNGRGFAESGCDGSDGLGLKIMRYRAQILGADLTFEHAPDGGTTVHLSCSLAHARPSAAVRSEA